MPLLGQNGNSGPEQWIFPSLWFTCSGRLTQWIFRAASPQNTILSRQCRINIATWRLDASSSRTTYTRHTSTAGRLRRITNNNSIITYELASPVQVEPDDIVGIELQTDSRCSLSNTGPGNILSLDLSSTDKISQSYRHFVIDSNFRATYLVPFIQPVIGKIMYVGFPLWFGIGNRSLEDRSIATELSIDDPLKSPAEIENFNLSSFFTETATDSETVEEPTVGNTMFIAQGSTSKENATATTIVTDPLISSQPDGEMSTMSRNGPLSTRDEVSSDRNSLLSTTTDDSSDTANTKEPRDKIILIIHIATGVGIGAIVLLSMAVACIGILKCMQAKSANGRRSDDIEKPTIVISSSTGMLLQENTAYRKNRWSETLSTEGGENSDIKQLQNASNSDNLVVGYETISTEEQFESKLDSAQQQDNFNSNAIVVQENTAYKKSTSSREIVAYESTSTEQNRGSESHQCANSSRIVVHKNTAYKKSTNGGDTVAGYETMDEIDEQVMQLNQAYGLQGESQEGRASRRERVSAGDYETMTGDSAYDHSGGAHRGVDKHSTLQLAEPVVYDSLSQQQSTNLEDNEHSYDYVI